MPPDDPTPWLSGAEWRLAVALAIGLLIGLERERRKGEGSTRSAAGLRTFGLVGLLGGVAALKNALKQVEQRLLPEHQPIIDSLVAGKRHKLIGYDMNRSREWVTRVVLARIIPELTAILNS